jgi:hypothetical protein
MLEQDLGGGLEGAAGAGQFHSPVQISLGVRELLCERQRIAGFDQHVEAPGLDLFALRLGLFEGLRVFALS